MYETNQIKLGIFANMIGINYQTLQRYDREGKLVAFRTDTGRRYYTIDHLKQWKQMNKK